MSLPGATVTTRATAPPRSAPVATGVLFAAGFCQQGPTTPQTIRNLTDYVNTYGIRVSYGLLYDALDVFFQEGGSQAICARVIGPSPVKATHTFLTSSSTNSLVVTADSYGDYGNSISVAILAGLVSGYRVQVSYNSVIVETSGDLTTQADAVAWSAGSQYVTIAAGNGSGAPADITATALSGGTDDHADATDTHWLNAINLFTKDLGPGQIAMPGRSTGTAHANLLAHAQANNRRALIDYADSGDRATLVTAAATDMALNGSQYGQGYAPWGIVGGITSGTTRTVPYSAVAAGQLARNDNAGITPNQPSAGLTYGVSNSLIGLSQPAWLDADRELLNDAGITVGLIKNGSIVTWGLRSLADPTQDAEWLLFSNSRLVMAIVAQAQAIAESYVFEQIDFRGLLEADFAMDLTGMLIPFSNEGSLNNYSVDVGPQVNTPETLAALELHALISLQPAGAAEVVVVEIVTTTNTQGVTA